MNTRQPTSIQHMLLFRISRFFGVAGGMAMRMCEARFGLTRREWGVMATLATEEGLLSSELAQKVQLDRARTSRALGGLEDKGWVLRKPLDGDRRRVAMYLTDEGRRMYGLILPEMVKIHADIVSILSDEELALFDGLLAKLQAHAVTLEQQDRYADLPRIGRSRPPR
ncbi:MarR family transcriptional regulator [Comamonas testosteroni]|nr:MarR family transcriptional regulator [Comamonas testosteroni]WKL17379.1 MarR family transcriptional regulator [Comamonas testosteroni]